MKKIFLLILLVYCQHAFSQLSTSEIEKILKQPDWSFVINWNTLSSNHTLPKFTVNVKITDSIKINLQKVTKQQWQKFIKDEATQWNANLFLYELQKKNAMPFFVAKDRKEWEKTYRKSDVAYWSKPG